MSMVFVSYSRQDQDTVSELIARLKEKGVPIWVDTEDIQTGTDWELTIEDALNQATHILVVLSKASVTSQTVRAEINWALDEDKKVVPILLDNCTRPLRIRNIQYIDFTENYIAAFDELVRQLPRQNGQSQDSSDDDFEQDYPELQNDGVFGHDFVVLPEDKESIYEGGKFFFPMLVFMSTDRTNKRHWTMKVNTVYIGREPYCEIVVPSRKISRRQAKIVRIEDKFQIIDLDSTNGTWINNKRLSANRPIMLKHGDDINFSGVFHVKFQYVTIDVLRDAGSPTMRYDDIDLSEV